MLEDSEKKPLSARFSENALTHHARAEERGEWIDLPAKYHHAYISWAQDAIEQSAANRRMLEWKVECTVAGIALLYDSVSADPEIRGGQPVLKGTRFRIAQLLVELSDSSGVAEVAYDFHLTASDIRNFLRAFSLLLEAAGHILSGHIPEPPARLRR